MKEIVVLSGKGGTGKTSIVGSFAVLAENKILADCDVDAADLHLLLHPEIIEDNEFWSGQTASIDKSICTDCGLCGEVCRFGAVGGNEVDSILCEGCGFCRRVCPAKAISMRDNLSGRWYVSDTEYGKLVYARLGIAQENSGKLVSTVRKKARELARDMNLDYIITDGPPGIGCPVISSISGTSIALIVTEPTLSGLHDLNRILELCEHFGTKAMVCINKYDINEENSEAIKNHCTDRDVVMAGYIPYDNIVTEAMIHGKPVVKYKKNRVSRAVKALWEQTLEYMGG